MKLFLVLVALSFSAFAQDMSRTETYEQGYRENSDGSTTYIGGCGLHQDYESKLFTVSNTIIEYFEPYGMKKADLANKIKPADKKLIAAVEKAVEMSVAEVDDLKLETLKSDRFSDLKLYRFNVGVGGGNGIYFVFEKTKNGYKLLSQVMDGDVQFCDKKVWIK